MASGSGKNQDHTESKEPVDSLRQREESSAAAAAAATEPPPLASESESTEDEVHGPPEAGGRNPSAADATESPPFAPQSEITEDEVHGPPEAGGQNLSAATSTATAAAGEQKDEEAVSLFWPAWGKPPLPPGDGKPPLPPRPPFVSGEAGQSSASADIDLKDVFDELMLECQKEKGAGETDQKADEAEGMPKQQDEQAKSPALRPKKVKKLLLRKKVQITKLIRHYNLLEMVASRGVEFHSYALKLHNAYSEFNPVHEDGECFYRSFIFSYLEQVLDRQDSHEEHCVLAAVKGLARQHARLGWASEFHRRHKAFKKLIKKVLRWKTHRRRKHVPTVNSYCVEKLLEFFDDNKRTVDTIWICSHCEESIPLVRELGSSTCHPHPSLNLSIESHNEGYTLTEMKQPAVQPKEGKKALWRKFPARRNVMIIVLFTVSLLMLPVKTDAFQHFDSIEDAAQRLAGLNNLGDLRLQLEEETPIPGLGFNFFLYPLMIVVCSILILGLLTWFIDPKEEH